MCHYSEETLDKYRSGEMSCLIKFFCYCHLLYCKKCQKIQKSLEKDEFLIQDIRNHLKKEQFSKNEITYQKLCRYFHSNSGSSI